MGKFQQNNLGSVVLDHHPTTAGGGNFSLWSSCRRKIIDTMRCGGCGYRHRHTVKSPVVEKPKEKEEEEVKRSECRSDAIHNQKNGKVKKSEKLSELLRMSESWSSEEGEEDVKKKVEVLEELKRVVKRLQCGGDAEVLGGAKEVRRLAKEDLDARTTLALLGAIPPLVAMLDSGDLDSQIAALYALLNLGIGNDP